MKALPANAWLVSAIVLLATCVSAAAYLAQPGWLAVPLGVISLLMLLRHPTYLFYLLLAAIPWSTEWVFPSGLGTDLPDEPLMWLMTISVLALLATGRKLMGGRPLHLLLILLALQFAWTIITVFTSTYFTLSLKYLLAKGWYLMAFVFAPLLLWEEHKVLKRSVIVLAASMLTVTAVTMIRHAVAGFSFGTINPALIPFFRNHVNYSALLVVLLPLQVLFWKSVISQRQRWLIAAPFFITIPAVYFSYARGAWLAILVGLVAYWLLRKGWLFRSYVTAALLMFLSVFWLKQNDRYLAFAHDFKSTIFHQDFNEHIAATYQLKDVSTAERFHRWVAGVRMAEENWQTGFGPNTFYQHYKSYTVPAFKTWVSANEEQSTVHNYFLLLLVEQGAIGLLLFITLLGACFWYAQQLYQTAADIFIKRCVAAVATILAMLCLLNFLSDLIETDKVGSVFYLSIAALIVLDKMKPQPLNGL